MPRTVTILGLESSCDDTAAAVVQASADGSSEILSSLVFDQLDLHAPHGGIVPEIAARSHTEKLDICTQMALDQGHKSLSQINAIAVTAGPGLIGGLLAGVMFAKGLCAARNIPLVGVNHLAGHALSPKITDELEFPFLLLLASGGHCQFLIVKSYSSFERLGGTIDDSPGEAFDKIARLLGLSQPGGPAIERLAMAADAKRFPLPRPLIDREDCNVSFSGLKTAVVRTYERLVGELTSVPDRDRADLAAAFQAAVADVLAAKSRRALTTLLRLNPLQPVLAVAGGVAANSTLRQQLSDVASELGTRFIAPPMSLCTDNAAMIAYAGGMSFLHGQQDDLDLAVRPRWPLDTAAPSMLGSGRKGAKA
ncbi:MAG: tRNA (adenosine(37)-N6)-threonylcarbamoyltransferase complex transferase subunit TsaD [Aestuariivita sp.]|nr:tRNA (adenosine(37)-N6)-threonylcarbamoyltransferase complex transferase subunit TsaD [Aestuariivita sp.]MCY4203395.1 tRNA (adenosine(37)-N6)-threonylcarbamoyltransferase complex transferase subunit TsaD [Aestuariivita sp.]MCY4288323.1 tRNA (adenosine(37)-N6)-threonylcarbamoyltransferase complex transferase subunit TsaD [Aestuariivita sp.]MCY4345649.1 tRNA (adenosine(37)-N6)-threonylcarbamoyltransferase complex transferase subunit TsaD [Aestuariivita sp.]